MGGPRLNVRSDDPERRLWSEDSVSRGSVAADGRRIANGGFMVLASTRTGVLLARMCCGISRGRIEAKPVLIWT